MLNLYKKIIDLNSNFVGKKIKLALWIIKIKRMGSLSFITGIDSSDYIQIVVKVDELIEKVDELIEKGDLLEVKGIVKKKVKKTDKAKDKLELELTNFKLINKSSALPFEISENKENEVNEDLKYKYRYLDLRFSKSKEKLLIKNNFIYEIRKYLNKNNFIDIETPILSQKSPEGAKCFLVISNYKDRYYTLPQSPQIFKQILMIGGINRYYQIAKSFRNEDIRSNRQIEFLQLDLEISFTNSSKIKKFVENLLKKIIKVVFDNNYILNFKTMTYKQVMEKYRIEKPNLNNKKEKNNILNFLWITEYPLFIWNEKDNKYDSNRHPFTNLKKNMIEKFSKGKININEIISDSFDLILNGEEILSGGMRIDKIEIQKKILKIIGYDETKQKREFGYFLKAMEFATPIHGGFGLGIDRLLSILLKTKNLKELIAFPKNIDGSCSLTKTPNFIDEK